MKTVWDTGSKSATMSVLSKRGHPEVPGLRRSRVTGCSGGQSAGWDLLARTFPEMAKRHGNLPPWQQCCVAHDRAYHAGGGRQVDAEASYTARLRADDQLRRCVVETGERRVPVLMADYGLSRDQVSALYRSIADVMYKAVRLGGAPCTGLPWRWGFGWPQCK